MPKIKIRVSICNSQNKNEYETNGIIQDDILKYKEPNKTTVLYNYKEDILIRENKELKMNYILKKKQHDKQNFLFLKDLQKKLFLNLKVTRFKKQRYNLYAEFKIEEENFKYKIEVVQWVL